MQKLILSSGYNLGINGLRKVHNPNPIAEHNNYSQVIGFYLLNGGNYYFTPPTSPSSFLLPKLP